MRELFGMWIKKFSRSTRQYQLDRAIKLTQRDIELTSREICEKMEARRQLYLDLMNLKIDRDAI